MKISRSYLLGLGSGLILSALIAMVVPNVGISFGGDSQHANQANQNTNLANTKNQSGNVNQQEPVTESKPNSESSDDSEGKTNATAILVIPTGSTAERIADLLLVEGWISSKEDFLDLVKGRDLASRFRAGSFELTHGMNNEEIIDQLIQ